MTSSIVSLRKILPKVYWRHSKPDNISPALIAERLLVAIECMNHGEVKRAQHNLLKVFNHSEVVEITNGLTLLMSRTRPIETSIPGDGKL